MDVNSIQNTTSVFNFGVFNDEECVSTAEESIAATNKSIVEHSNDDNEQLVLLLRRQLNRRNILLELLQQAYYRDVIVIKEALFRLEADTVTSNATLPREQLYSIPSVDIRSLLLNATTGTDTITTIPETDAFQLFAPTECELRCKPCQHCGGTFHIVHKECDLFQTLRQQLAKSHEREHCLQRQLTQLEDQTQLERADFKAKNAQAVEANTSMEQTISTLQQTIRRNEDLVRQAEAFEATLNFLSNKNIDWENKYNSAEEANASYLLQQEENHRVVLEKLQMETDGVHQKFHQAQQDLANARLSNQQLGHEINTLTEEITSLTDQKEFLVCQIENLSIQLGEKNEETQRTRYLLGQAQQSEELLQQKIMRLEKCQQEMSVETQTKCDHLHGVMKQMQRESMNEKALQKRHFLSVIRGIKQQHVEEVTSKNDEIHDILYGDEAKARQNELREMVERLVSSAKIMARVCIQQRSLLKRHGCDVIGNNNGSIISTEVSDRIQEEIKNLITGCAFADFHEANSDDDDVEKIPWGELLRGDKRNEILDYLKCELMKNVLSMTTLIENVKTQSEITLKEAQNEIENVNLDLKQTFVTKIHVLEALLEEKDELCRAQQGQVTNLMQQVTDMKKECFVIQNRCEAGMAIANDMEMKLIQKQLEMKELQTDLFKASEQINQVNNELRKTIQESEMYRMACCDADARYEAIAQSLHAVLRKEEERSQTNKSIEIQCACCMHDAAVQIDLVSSSSLTYNKSSLLLPPQVTNGYNSQCMRPKYFVAPTPLLFMRRNTSACDTTGVMNVFNSPTK